MGSKALELVMLLERVVVVFSVAAVVEVGWSEAALNRFSAVVTILAWVGMASVSVFVRAGAAGVLKAGVETVAEIKEKIEGEVEEETEEAEEMIEEETEEETDEETEKEAEEEVEEEREEEAEEKAEEMIEEETEEEIEDEAMLETIVGAVDKKVRSV